MYLMGEFREQGAAANAILWLRDSGICPGDLDVFSEEPVEFRRGVLDRPSHMSLLSVTGGIALGVAATVVVYFAQHDYKLVTGGMPIFSFWATGIISFEMTMLGAIVTAVGCFLWESGLLRRRDNSRPVPKIYPGSICLSLRCGLEEAGRASELMRRAGAIEIKRTEEA